MFKMLLVSLHPPCTCTELKAAASLQTCRALAASRRHPQCRCLSIKAASTLEAPVQPSNITASPPSDLLKAIKSIYTTQDYLEDAFSSGYTIESPIFKCASREELKRARLLLLSVADVDFTIHKLSEIDSNVFRARWTLEAKLKGIPGRQRVVLTGHSQYTVSPAGVLLAQTDTFDAVPMGGQLDSITFLLKNAFSLQSTPDLDTPQYSVLKKMQDYEIREYPPFLVAEIFAGWSLHILHGLHKPSWRLLLSGGPYPELMCVGAGTGFNELASYIFGGNTEKQSMEMTTPVLTTAGQQGADSNRMAFVMESKYVSIDSLPIPRDSRILTRQQEGCIMAALSFSGLPLDFEVTEAERRLRGLLMLDGLQADKHYFLARYNDPFTLPALRRNEILIRLEGFELD